MNYLYHQFKVRNGTNKMDFTFLCYEFYNNSLHSFKSHALIINSTAFSPYLSNIVMYWNTNNHPFSFNLDLPSVYGHPLSDHHCIIAYFGFDRHFAPSQFYFTNTNGDISSLTVTTADTNHVVCFQCFIVCPIHTFVDYTNDSSICINCTDFNPYCLNCTSKTQCIACIQTAALANGSCSLCFKHIFACQTCKSTVQCTQCFIGNLAPGGCTTVVGCTKVLQVYTPIFQGVCIDCNSSEFIYNFIQKKCDCKIG